jgi:uncharacterized membrane protein YedE/YeeE
MALIVTSFLSGLIFGIGLSVSEMVDPARVQGFLDVFGKWDMTLGFVMAGALAVTLPAYALILRRRSPICADSFAMPVKKTIDGRLIAGAALFGVGWGLAGFCPGPALANLATGAPAVIEFIAAMIIGQWLAGLLPQR